jgi:cytochrome c biogenesis protein CcdA
MNLTIVLPTAARARSYLVLLTLGGVLLLLAGPLRGRLDVATYYYYLSVPFSRYSQALGAVADGVRLPVLSALILGFVGALAPCQLSGNLAALMYACRDGNRPRHMAASTVAYVVGKVTVYTLMGAAAVWMGIRLEQAAIPVVVGVRKAMGPLLVVVGLVVLNVVPLRIGSGSRLAGWLESHLPQRGLLGAYGLGVAFGFAFCPTLFWLFFGLTLPLAVGIGGLAVPPAFAMGTAVPLLVFTALATAGGLSTSTFVRTSRSLDRWVSRLAGAVLVLIGLNEIVLYWLV